MFIYNNFQLMFFTLYKAMPNHESRGAFYVELFASNIGFHSWLLHMIAQEL